jgi:hypothetical protein
MHWSIFGDNMKDWSLEDSWSWLMVYIEKASPLFLWGFFSLKIILCEFLFFLVVQVYMVNDGVMWSLRFYIWYCQVNCLNINLCSFFHDFGSSLQLWCVVWRVFSFALWKSFFLAYKSKSDKIYCQPLFSSHKSHVTHNFITCLSNLTSLPLRAPGKASSFEMQKAKVWHQLI